MNRLEREQTLWTGALAPASRYLGTGNVADLIRHCPQMGLIGELRAKFGFEAKPDRQAVRDLVYKLRKRGGLEPSTLRNAKMVCSRIPVSCRHDALS